MLPMSFGHGADNWPGHGSAPSGARCHDELQLAKNPKCVLSGIAGQVCKQECCRTDAGRSSTDSKSIYKMSVAGIDTRRTLRSERSGLACSQSGIPAARET